MKITTTSVEVYKVLGETMEIAFNNLKQSERMDNATLSQVTSEFGEDAINNGKIYKHAQYLHREYLNGRVSEFTVFGTLYNKKPIILDASRVVMQNIVIRGTKQWETVNSYRFDSGAVIEEDTNTKADALAKARELAIQYNKTVNIVVSKRLKDMDGILGIAEFMPLDCTDDANVYVFWAYCVEIEEKDESDSIEENVEQKKDGQLCIKEDLYGYVARQIINR